MSPTSAPAHIVLGTNNVWPFRLAEGGWVLVDAGPDGEDGGVSTWDALVQQARGLGFAPRDVRAVIVTHEHIDHAGLAARWAGEGARIVAGRAAMPALVGGLAALEAHRAARADELRRHGCPEDAVWLHPHTAATWDLRWDPCPAGAIDAAEERAAFALEGGCTLRLIATPGHTPGHVVALVEETGELCSGDALLHTTVPTPGLHFPDALAAAAGGRTSALRPVEAPRWRSLPPFIESVVRLVTLEVRGVPVRRVLPGHGEIIEDAPRLMRRFLQHHERRARRVRAHLASRDADTAYGVARGLFHHLPPDRTAQAMVELIGHLDLLEASGEVERLPGEPVRYRLVGSARPGPFALL